MIVEDTTFILQSAFLVKAFLVLFLIFYFFFSILLIRQVQIMIHAINTDLNRFLKLASFINFVVAAIALVFGILS